MSSTPAPEQPPAPSALVLVLGALGTVMAEERRAVAALDLAAIESLTVRKQAVADQLAVLHAAGRTASAAEVGAIAAARVELGVSAALVAAALEAVAAVLGYEPDGRYDRQARRQSSTRPLRVMAL